MSYCKLTIVGNLGRDPELRYDDGGTPWATFSVATSDQYGTKWFRVSVRGSQAEACHKYLKTGRQVLVDGDLSFDKDTGGPRQWERNDGSVGTGFEMYAHRVVFLSTGREEDDYEPYTKAEKDFPF